MPGYRIVDTPELFAVHIGTSRALTRVVMGASVIAVLFAAFYGFLGIWPAMLVCAGVALAGPALLWTARRGEIVVLSAVTLSIRRAHGYALNKSTSSVEGFVHRRVIRSRSEQQPDQGGFVEVLLRGVEPVPTMSYSELRRMKEYPAFGRDLSELERRELAHACNVWLAANRQKPETEDQGPP